MAVGNEVISFYRWLTVLIMLEFLKIAWQLALRFDLSYESSSYTILIRYTLFIIDTLWLFWELNGNIQYYSNWSANGTPQFTVEFTVSCSILSFGYVYALKYLVDFVRLCFLYPANRCYLLVPPHENAKAIAVL